MQIAEKTPTRRTTKPVEERQATLSQRGFAFFIRASIDYPASVTAQAASVALLTRGEGLDVHSVAQFLLSDKAKVLTIKRAGETAHRKNPDAPQSLGDDEVGGIITSVFARAEYFTQHLSEEDLSEILASYQRHLREGRGKEKTGLFIEDRVNTEAERIIEKAKARESTS